MTSNAVLLAETERILAQHSAYHILAGMVPYHELGPDYLDQRRTLEHRTKRLVRQLEQLGHNVTLEPSAT